jgi:hypothetical protein
MINKIVKLVLDEDSLLGGIDAVALVENPAIEEDFFMFAKEEFESYNDYPKAAVEAAKQGIKRNEALGNKCGTQVGKVRAQQLANGENLTLDTIRRMRSFLLRQKDNYDLAVSRKDYDACGYISYLLWGGPAALPWAEKKLRQAGEEFDLDEACWPGYEAIGTKIKDGREVPNCVPVQASKEEFEKLVLETIIKENLFAQIGEIDGSPIFSTIEEAEAKAKEMGCEGYHEHKLGEDVIGYMPCKSHEDAVNEGTKNAVAAEDMAVDVSALPNYISELPKEKQDKILDALYNVGTTEATLAAQGYKPVSKDNYNRAISEAFAIVAEPNKGSVADFGQYKVLYKYVTSPGKGADIISTSRDFCKSLMRKNLLFRKEDINNLSVQSENAEFGFYDIFKWRGSYNCRHFWQAQLFSRDNTDPKKATANLDILSSSQSTKPLDANTGVGTGLNTTVSNQAFSELEEKQMLIGPLMTPNKLIPRRDKDGEMYHVYFDEATVEKLAYRFMEDKLNDSVNIEHNDSDRVNDVTLVETWLVKDPEKDKSTYYGYEPTKGQWFGMYRVNNKKVWDEYVKTGKVKGFSVQGYFTEMLDKYTKSL